MNLGVSDFDVFLKQQRDEDKPSLIMFHVGWCKVCQKLFPLFSLASDVVHDRMLGMSFAHVDCESHKALCTRYSVKGYPQFMLFPADGAEARKYRGVRNKDGFVKYAERMTQPPVLRATDQEGFAAKGVNETLATFVAALPIGEAQPPAFVATASIWMDRHRFVAGPSLAKLLPEGIGSPPAGAVAAAVSWGTQQWAGRGEAQPAAAFYTGSLDDKEGFSAWVERNRFPGVWELGEDNFFEFTHGGRTTAIIAVDPLQLRQEQDTEIRSAAKELSDAYLFGVVNGTEFSEELKGFGLLKEDFPRILVTENDLDYWVEDIDFVTFKRLKADLRALHEGAPLLRQSYSTMGNIWWYKRDGYRRLLDVRAYALKGPMESVCVAAAACGVLFVFYMALSFTRMLLGVLFEGPEMPEPPRPAKKRD